MDEVMETVSDYSYPYMQAKDALKNLHNAMLRNDFDAAMVEATKAIVEARLAYIAIVNQKEQHR